MEKGMHGPEQCDTQNTWAQSGVMPKTRGKRSFPEIGTVSQVEHKFQDSTCVPEKSPPPHTPATTIPQAHESNHGVLSYSKQNYGICWCVSRSWPNEVGGDEAGGGWGHSHIHTNKIMAA